MEFYISTLLGSKQVVHHHFICITTSFRSQLYLGHNNFYIATLFESEQVLDHNFIWIIPSFTSSLYLDQNKFCITMFIASVDADGDLVFYPSLRCKASDAQKLIFNGRQYALIFTCYIILIYPYFFGILSLSMGGERGGGHK